MKVFYYFSQKCLIQCYDILKLFRPRSIFVNTKSDHVEYFYQLNTAQNKLHLFERKFLTLFNIVQILKKHII